MITLDVSSGIELEYLAEGAANIVYKINPHPSTPSIAADSGFYDYEPGATELAAPEIEPGLEGKLVRLRKASGSNCSVFESYEYHVNTIVPILPRAEDRVEYVLFRPTASSVAQLNRELRVMEQRQLRLEKRCGTYLAEDEDYGLLVTDMSCSSPSSANFKHFEFKPKWLLQSPSAPLGAIRCRICALRNFRRAQNHKNLSADEHLGFCPLGLVSKDRQEVVRTLSGILNWSAREADTDSAERRTFQERLIDLIHENPLLNHLRQLQSDLDPHGVLLSPFSDSRFLTAMTLRDCTVFIKIPIGDEGRLEVRLGDLDFKSPSNGKGEYWRTLEGRLIEEEWYTAEKKAEVELDDFCLLTHGAR